MAFLQTCRRLPALASLAVLVLCFAAAAEGFVTFVTAPAILSRLRTDASSLRYRSKIQAANTRLESVRSSRGSSAAAAGLLLGIASLRKLRNGSRLTRVSRRGQMQPDLPDAGIAVIEKEDLKTQMKAEFEKEKWWRVLLHNDDIHTFEYVTGCLTKVVQHLTRRKAYNITWEAHSSGKATVACVWKALAEQFCVKLQQDGLTVSIAPDSKFEGNKGGQ
eukprot:TRINITY_DN62001_c0_g1_i1.p1 TRINITY_DN62001_c0_g1~~TRINITY_DN62001_c0_g1_i1.p1  ORF type:complete len:233 (+),score=52.15 TRINITY_DN62001_c0_g1_i1:45-701(+)